MNSDFRSRIHPQLRPWYDRSEGFDLDNLSQFVPRMNALELSNLRPDEAVSVYETEIAGPSGAPPVKLRIYEPKERAGLRPALLFFHGGGFLFGTVYRQENLCQRYAKHVGCVVISVEYRLAPQWQAPAPVEDAYAALTWVYEQGEAIGIDRERIAAAGLSAGGTIVAALAMMARDRGGPSLCLQMPLYAELDNRLNTASAHTIVDKKVWCYENNRLSWEHYLPKGRDLTAYDVPWLSTDLSKLPPVFSFVGGLDPVRDENLAFWQRLMADSVPVEGHVFPGAYHCFELGMPEADLSKSAYELSYGALRRAFFPGEYL